MKNHQVSGFLFLVATSFAIAACSQGSPNEALTLPSEARDGGSASPLQHVVVIIQENRSFDNFFAKFPGADGASSGKAAPMSASIAYWCAEYHQPVITQATSIPLTEVTLLGKGFKGNYHWDMDLDHTYPGHQIELDGGKMDGFDLVNFGANGSATAPECTYAYQYVDQKDIEPYWDIAKQYVLADHMFQTQGSSSFTAHQDLIAGGTAVNYGGDNSVIDNPYAFPWGCDSPPGTRTALITTSGTYLPTAGPKPCYTYATLRDLLDAKKVSWRYYAVGINGGGPGIWSAFDAIKAVRQGPEWSTNVTTSPKVIFTDITKGQLPHVAWVTPEAANSDHPFEIINKMPVDTGPSWVASVVVAIGESKYWKSSAIIILWDDSGGFYDHEQPAFFDDQGGLGFRVPMLIVSPYVKAHIEHTQYETASIVKFIEDNWRLGGPLQTPDARATSIGNAFDFTQSPRPFKPIQSKLSRSFFLLQKPSGLPLDSQ